jgi:hypothetical protein
MTPHFVAYEVEIINRESLEDFDGQYEEIGLRILLKSSGNPTKIKNDYIVERVLELLKKI